ncbi:hypothetical protein QUB78_31160 [Microcoleus sp. ARI1-A4]|uniref:hypothetical protein n=1 Tax=unclassified Microcoleus TaxID=2642155 RepID=UPI002FD24094
MTNSLKCLNILIFFCLGARKRSSIARPLFIFRLGGAIPRVGDPHPVCIKNHLLGCSPVDRLLRSDRLLLTSRSIAHSPP